MDADDVKKAQEAFKAETKKAIKDALDAADAHPIGHIVCELVRGNVKGELQTGEDVLKKLWGCIVEETVPEEFRPKKPTEKK